MNKGLLIGGGLALVVILVGIYFANQGKCTRFYGPMGVRTDVNCG